MTTYLLRMITALALCLAAGSGVPAAGQAHFRVVSNLFPYGFGGLGPLTEPSLGVFYGYATVLAGGSGAYAVTSKGSLTTLATWPSGYNIGSALVTGPNNLGYSVVGDLSVSGPTAFSVTPAPGSLQMYPPQSYTWTLSQALPNGTLLAAAHTTSLSNLYYVATVDLKGAVTPVYHFPLSYQPIGGPIYASDGNYYGIIAFEGQQGGGYVFRMTPSGTLTKIYTYPSGAFGGAGFSVPLIQASDGNLYSAIDNGGANHNGIIYRVTLNGHIAPVYTFPAGKKAGPSALIEGSDGNLYGSTIGNYQGTIFRVTKSGQYTLLYTMGSSAGACPCNLLQGSDGGIYGTAGTTVFVLDAGLPKPAPRALSFTPTSGAAGTQVQIWGYSLLSASVQFNGVAATSVSNSGPDYVLATVPAGATTGPITVTTPGGTSTTKSSFTVQ